MKRNLRIFFGVIAIAGVMLFGATVAMPKPALAWSGACQLNPATTIGSADITVLPDGTVYAALFNSNVTSVYKWAIPSCSMSKVKTFNEADLDVSSPEAIEGPVQSARPDIASNSDGDIVVAYRKGSNFPYKLYYARKLASESNFESPVLVSDNAYAGDIKLGDNGAVHITYYRSAQGTTGAFYQRFNKNDNSTVGPLQLNSYHDAEPEMDLDADGNAHVVYMDDGNDLRYRRVAQDGSLGASQLITNNNDAFFPYIGADSQGDTHIVWQGRNGSLHQIYYRKCNNQGSSCGEQKNLSKSSPNNSLDGHVETCGTSPYVSWYRDIDASGNNVFVSKDLGKGKDISGNVGGASAFNILAKNGGKIVIAFRNSSGTLSYSYQDDASCTFDTEPGTPTATPTATDTPTSTNTPDPSISPTATHTPTATLTPPPGKVFYDDKSDAIEYAGVWRRAKNGPDCVYHGTYRRAVPNPNNTLSLDFNGTRIKYMFVTGPDMGKADVWIDGQLKSTVNLHRSFERCKRWLSEVLPAGAHTFELRPNGSGKINVDVLVSFP